MSRVSACMLFAMVFLLLGGRAQAEDPPYRLLAGGQAVEIEGVLDKEGRFTAEEIELLPAPRRPKLRGTILDKDSTQQRIRVLGQWVSISPKTQFLDIGDQEPGWGLLVTGARVEISCKVDSGLTWSARHIRIRDVKDSDKLKGTISSVEFDGDQPESFVIDGFPVYVDKKTSVFKTLGPSTDSDEEEDASQEDSTTSRVQ
ncbi:MAG: DUF5666 domain-containing protein [Candidatus Zixiibacteriota bacterium]